MTGLLSANFNDLLPPAPTGKANIKWQADLPTVPIRDISAYVPNFGGVDARIGTTERISSSSQGMLVTLTNASPVIVTLGSANGLASIIVDVGGGGTGYAVNDTFNVNGGTGGTGHVTSVSGGVVIGVAIDQEGSGYVPSSGVTTTTTSGVGTGLILVIGAVVNGAPDKFVCWAVNEGAGLVTIIPAVGTIDNAASLAMSTNQGAVIFWDGSDWWTVRGVPTSGTGGTAVTVTEISLAPGAPGNFTIAHGLSTTPTFVLIQMTSGGSIWLQNPTGFDATNLYLVASDAGITGIAAIWTVTADAEISLAPGAPGNFTVAHGLGGTPALALIEMKSDGAIWFQTPTPYDATNLYLVASDAGLVAKAEVWLKVPSIAVVNFAKIALAPGAPGNFTVAHGLGRAPTLVIIRMTSGGAIWLQEPTPFDSTNLYLVASDSGITGEAEVWT